MLVKQRSMPAINNVPNNLKLVNITDILQDDHYCNYGSCLRHNLKVALIGAKILPQCEWLGSLTRPNLYYVGTKIG